MSLSMSLTKPHRKKSQGLRSGEKGGHSIPPPANLWYPSPITRYLYTLKIYSKILWVAGWDSLLNPFSSHEERSFAREVIDNFRQWRYLREIANKFPRKKQLSIQWLLEGGTFSKGLHVDFCWNNAIWIDLSIIEHLNHLLVKPYPLGHRSFC